MPRNGDLTIEWDAANHEAVIGHIQALIDQGITFHRIETKGTGKMIPRRVAGRPIGSIADITDRRLLIKDADCQTKREIPPVSRPRISQIREPTINLLVYTAVTVGRCVASGGRR
jgi:hypothetical protein